MHSCLLPCAADDSAAFQRAIDAAVAAAKQSGKGVAVIIPPGRFEIRQTISIGGSNVVLRGSGVRRGQGGCTVCHGAAVQACCARQYSVAICLEVLTGLHPFPPLPNTLCPPHAQVGQTTIYIPLGLRAVYGDARNWAFQGGFIG